MLQDVCEDIWLHVFSYTSETVECIRLYIGLRLWRYVSEDSLIWIKHLQRHFLRKNKDLEDTMFRFRSTMSLFTGLNLYKKLNERRKCSRSGCFAVYREIDNDNSACCYHPGRMKPSRSCHVVEALLLNRLGVKKHHTMECFMSLFIQTGWMIK